MNEQSIADGEVIVNPELSWRVAITPGGEEIPKPPFSVVARVQDGGRPIVAYTYHVEDARLIAAAPTMLTTLWTAEELLAPHRSLSPDRQSELYDLIRNTLLLALEGEK